MISAPPSDDDRKNPADPTGSGSLDADSVDLSFEQELEDLFAEDLGLPDDLDEGSVGEQSSEADDLLAELAGEGFDTEISEVLEASGDEGTTEGGEAAATVLGEEVSIDDDEGAVELTDLAPAEADPVPDDMDILELAPDAVVEAEDGAGETEAVVVAADEDEDGEVMLLDELLEAGDESEAEDEIVELAEALPGEQSEESAEELAVVVPEPDAATVEAAADEGEQLEQPESEPVELEPLELDSTDFEDALAAEDGPALAETESLLSSNELQDEFTEELEGQLEPDSGDEAPAYAGGKETTPPGDMPSAIPAAALDALAENAQEPEDLGDLDDLGDLGDLESFDMNIPDEPAESAAVGESEEIDLDGLDGLLNEMGSGEAKNVPEATAEEGDVTDDIGDLADIEALLEQTEAELAGEEEPAGAESDDLAEMGVDDLDALLEGVGDDDLEIPEETSETTPQASLAEEAEGPMDEVGPDLATQSEDTAGEDESLLGGDLLDEENIFMAGDLTTFDGVELPDIDVSEFDADLPGEGRDEVARLLDDINPEEFADTSETRGEPSEQPLTGASLANLESAAAAAPGSCEDFKARLVELERRGADMDAVLDRLSLLEDKVQAMDEALDAARAGLRSLEDRSADLESALEGFDERFKDEIEQAVPLEAARIIREEIAALARELDG